MSDDFADYINYWRHNGFWLFNRPSDMDEIIAREEIDRSGLTLFYYEVHEQAFDSDAAAWIDVLPDESFVTSVEPPLQARLDGYDVVCFTQANAPEHSPLSCNGLADELPVNRHCLFDTLEAAKSALSDGALKNCEPGPYRILAVYTVTA